MTKTTKVLFGIAGMFLIISVIVGWQSSKTEELGALAAAYPGIIFVIALTAALARLMVIDPPKSNPLGRQHKKLDKYLAYGLLVATLIVAFIALKQQN